MLTDLTNSQPVHVGHRYTNADKECRKTDEHFPVSDIHNVVLLSFFRLIHVFNVNLKRDDFIKLKLIVFNGPPAKEPERTANLFYGTQKR